MPHHKEGQMYTMTPEEVKELEADLLSGDARILTPEEVAELKGETPKDKKKSKKESARQELSRNLEDQASILESSLNDRAKQFGKPENFSITTPELPNGLTTEHLETMKQALGNGLHERILPSLEDLHNLDATYLDIMYPQTQHPQDEAKGLTSHRPDWWNKKAKIDGFTFTGTWGDAYVASMRKELSSISRGDQSTIILLDTALKPNYTHDKQHYGSIDGIDPSQDPLLSIFKQVFGKDANRFNHTEEELQTQFIPALHAHLEQALQEKNLPTIPFDVILVPATLDNLEATTKTPELSQTNTWEWTSTRLLDSNGNDTGRNLLACGGARGGASALVGDSRGARVARYGARFAVVFRSTEH